MRTHGTFGTLVKFTTVDVSLSRDVFDVKSALGRVNTHGISNLTQHQSKALFLCGKDSFVCLPTGHGKSLIVHFTVVCLVTWPLSGSEAGVDLVLIQTLLLFICKYKLVSMRIT